jgi:two-component system sensor kinase FixL
MKTEIATNPAYRKVVASLEDCEERYGDLIKSIGGTNDSRLKSTIATLKHEIQLRRDLEVELLTAVEAERQRIGQDLHDDLCQRLGAAALLVGTLGKKVSALDQKLGRKVAEIPRLITDAIESCRDLARGLHPVTLESAGLPAALEELAARVPGDVRFNWPHSERIDFEPMVALNLYRIAEEAVANAVKHARAQSIIIELAILAGRPVLAISDDGKGCGSKLKTTGMGLRNMRYRANVIGGELTVEPRNGGGTCVRCILPLRKIAVFKEKKQSPTALKGFQ